MKTTTKNATKQMFDVESNKKIDWNNEVTVRFSCVECELSYFCSDAELGELMERRKLQPCRHAWTSLKFHQQAEYWDEKKRYAQRTYTICSRCGGSGHYSYCQMYGTTCFKCAGRCYVSRTWKASLVGSAASLIEAHVGDTVVISAILYDVLSIIWAEKPRRRMVQFARDFSASEYDAQIIKVKARVSGEEKSYWRKVSAPDTTITVTSTVNGVTNTAPCMTEVERVPLAWRGQEVKPEHLAVIHEINRREIAQEKEEVSN